GPIELRSVSGVLSGISTQRDRATAADPGRTDHSSGRTSVRARNFPRARRERARMSGGLSDPRPKLICRTRTDQSAAAGASAKDTPAIGQWDEILAERARLGSTARRSARVLQT